MLIRVVTNYLAAHRRLVVPQLGAFLVKKPGESVLFSELMKRDDGVLRALLREAGVGELEAAGEIDRFVFEVRHAVERGESYPMAGFGRMMPGPGGSIVFEYDPESAEAEVDTAVAAAPKNPEAAAVSASEAPEPLEAAPGSPETDAASEGPDAAPSDSAAADDRAAAARPSSHICPDHVAEAVKSAFADEPIHVSASAKMNPEPYVRGLRYGKPHKTTDAYRYVDRVPRRRSLDRFLLLGIFVAAVAVGAILYGWWVNRQAERLEQQPLELPAAAPEASEAPDTSDKSAESQNR